jgi:NTP pyrophosphatase (non-canonical NTP hydrolase)
MNLNKIKTHLDQFAQERGWEKYRTPKNLSMALAVEAAELMEIFQWMDNEQSLALENNTELMQSIKEELADILSYLVQISSVLNIELDEAFWSKTKKIEKKYSFKNA